MYKTAYRYPNELFTLTITLLVLSIATLLAAGLSFCLLPLILAGIIIINYWLNRSHHQALLSQATPVDQQHTPRLAVLAEECLQILRPGKVNFFIAPNKEVNAYTFGFSEPKGVVLNSGIVKVMDSDELRFVIGHELGHVALGHAWFNTLLGGMAGIPQSFGGAVIITLLFRWWNRACEYSADRAGLLACGNLSKVTSALIKLVANDADSPAEIQHALQLLDQEDDSITNQMLYSLSSHPMIIQRIEKLRQYYISDEYRETSAQLRNFSHNM